MNLDPIPCPAACWDMPECDVCRRRKAPLGRDVPLACAADYCGEDCPGYRAGALPGHRWPAEHDDACSTQQDAECECDCARPGNAMSRRGKLRAARKRIEAHASELQERYKLTFSLCEFALDMFSAGYAAAEPDVCARCGAEMEKGDG